MRAALEQPGMIRYAFVLLVGLPVALIVSALNPERQGAGFVPFVIALVAALAVIWLLGFGLERLWLGRLDRAATNQRRRRG